MACARKWFRNFGVSRLALTVAALATGALAFAPSAGELKNTATINWTGNMTASPSVPASLDIAAAEFNSRGPTQAFVAVNSSTVTSPTAASLTVAGNYGNFATTNVDASGVGDSSLNITGMRGNTGGTVDVDQYQARGSSSSVGGTLENSPGAKLNFGNNSITEPTTVTAAGLIGDGIPNITGSQTTQSHVGLMGAASANAVVPSTGALGAGTSNLASDPEISWIGGTGNWSLAGNWTPSGSPDSNTDVVTIGSTGSGIVTLNSSATIGELILTSGYTLALELAPGSSLTVQQNGTITNGSVTINSGGTLELETSDAVLTASGELTNAGTLDVGSGTITTAATASAGELDNTGTINLTGNLNTTPATPASLDITAAAFNSGTPTQPFAAVNSGTITLLSDASLTVAGTFGNSGTINVDANGLGASSLIVAGVLGNIGNSVDVGTFAVSMYPNGIGILNFGNATITHATEITLAGLNNFGTVNITGSPTVQTLVDLTGPASANPFVQPPGMLNAGTYNLTNDAELEYSGPGISGIGSGVTVSLSGAGASIVATNIGNGTNSAFTTLAGNAGTFEISNSASVSASSPSFFINMGTVDVDQTGPGGSSLSVGGTLENSPSSTLSFGNPSITAPTTVTAAGLTNYGTLNITGSTTTQTLVDLTGPNPFVSSNGALGSGTYTLTNDAEIEYSGAGVGSIGTGATLNLNGAGASVNNGSGVNSALDTLAANTGTFEMSNGATVSTGQGLINASEILVDQSGSGGSTLSIGGNVLEAYGGILWIGNNNITTATTVTVNGTLTTLGNSDLPSTSLIPTGNAFINVTGATSVQATLNVLGAAPTALIGNYTVSGDALLEYASGAITAISGYSTETSGDSLTLVGPNARVALAGSTASSSALTGLASNGGVLTLENGANLSTNDGVNFVNSGGVILDDEGAGGSTLSIGGTIADTFGSFSLGNTGISSSTTVSAMGFALNTLTGAVIVTGEDPGSGSTTAALVLGTGVTSIGPGANLTLSNSNSYVALAGTLPLSNSGLVGLASNEGTLDMEDGAKVSTTAGINFSNDGTITVDATAATSGSSSLSIGGTLTNDKSFIISNEGTTGTSTAAVSATGLNNVGTIDLYGETSTHTATLTLSGNVINSGNIDIGSPSVGAGENFASLTVTGANSYTQIAGVNAGETTVSGTLTAATVDVNSGVVQGLGTIVGNVVNEGAVEGGISQAPAGFAITGNYTQSGTGVDYQLVSGISNGQFSSLNVSGKVTLGGLLDISTPTGFVFASGQSFDIINITTTGGSATGTFSGLEYNGQVANGSVLNIGGGLALDLTYNGNDVVLSVGTFTPSATADIWNAGSGTWNASSSNWSGGTAPSSTSDVTIGNSTGGTVTLATGASTAIDSLSVTNGYTLAYGAASQSLTTNAGADISTGGELDLENTGDTLTTGAGGGNGDVFNFGTVALANGAALNVGGSGNLTNAGTLTVENGATFAVAGDFSNGTPGSSNGGNPASATMMIEGGGASTIGGNFVNNGEATLDIDNEPTGGSTLTVTGTFTNGGNITIGNTEMTSPTTINVGNFINAGYLNLEGTSIEIDSLPNEPSVINVSGTWIPSSGQLDGGYYSLIGDAQINYSGPGITSLGSGTVLSLDGQNVSISNTNGSGAMNDALTTLTNIGAGASLDLSDGIQLTTNAGLTNSGVLQVDSTGSGFGGTVLTVGGVLTNNGTLDVGGGSDNPTTVTVAALVNNGSLIIAYDSNGFNFTGSPTVLDVTGSLVPATGALNQGSYVLEGDAVLEYNGPGITSLGSGVTLGLYGTGASLSLAPTTDTPANGALDTLTSNAGSLTVGDGASVVTNPTLNLTNTGSIAVTGGSVSVGGTLINSGGIVLSASSDSAATLTAAGFSNSGTVSIEGTAGAATILDITGVATSNPFVSASGVLSPGGYDISAGSSLPTGNDAEIEYTGPGITSIPVGASVDLFGQQASITATTLTAGTNNALSTLSSVGGALIMDGTGATTNGALLNTGEIDLGGIVESPDSYSSYLTVGGTLTNTSNSNLPCGGLCIEADAMVTANGLVNSGTITAAGAEYGLPGLEAEIILNGPAANSGTIKVDAGAQLSATGSFTNSGTGIFDLGGGNGLAEGATSSASAAGFNNSGTVYIAASSTDEGILTVTGSGNSYTQSSPLAVTAVLGSLNAPTVDINGGLLSGTGTITGNVVVNGATIAATNPFYYAGAGTPGLLSIAGNYTQTSTGVMDEFVQNTPLTRGSTYSAINVSGSVSLSGVLDITTLNGYTFAAGQTYDIMNSAPGQLSGAFSSIEYNNIAASGTGSLANALNIGGGLSLAVVYEESSGEVVLEVIPTPGPATVDNWIGATDVWTSNFEWSTGASPTSTQSVVVGTGSSGGQPTVTYNVPSSTIANLTVQPGGNETYYTLAFDPSTVLNVSGTVINSATIDVGASGAVLNSAGDITNAAGDFFVTNGGAVTVGTKAAPADFINQGILSVDGAVYTASTGGSTVTISGNLYDGTDVYVGNDAITSQATLSAASLSSMNGTTTLANTLNGSVVINGENPGLGSTPAVLQLGTSITSIGASGSLTLNNSNSFITTDTGPTYTNDGISALTSNAGALSLTGGASATITGALTNATGAMIQLQAEYFNENPSDEGYAYLSTTLNVGGLSNRGVVGLYGCTTTGCTAQALLNVTGSTGSFASGGALNAGDYYLSGNALLQYTGPGIASIGSGVTVDLSGASSSIEATNLTPNVGSTNSAFNTLTSNAGELNVSGASLATNTGLALTNSGYITISTGSISVGGVLTNNSGSTTGDPGIELGGGALSAAGLVNTGFMEVGYLDTSTFTINGTANNSGTIYVAGTGAQVTGAFTNTSTGNLQIAGATVDGGFEEFGTSSISVGGILNSGAVAIYSGPGGTGSLTVTGSGNSYTQTGSTASTLVEGTLTAPTVNINGGLLEGNGLINGNVTNAATVAAATGTTTPGLLTISGSYTQTSAGTLDEIVAGATTIGTDYSAINISGPAALAGALKVTSVPGFTFAADESFNIINMTPNQLAGTFTTFSYGAQSTNGTGQIQLGGGLALALAYNGSNGEVLLDVVTPDNWTSGSGNWSNASNWSIPGGAPGPTQLVDIGTGAGGTVTLDESANIYNLTMQAGTTSAYTLAFASDETLSTAGAVDIGKGAEIEVAANGANLITGGDLTNAGTLDLENGGVVTVGTASEPTNVDNAGVIIVDGNFNGGSSLNISGTLTNAGGDITIGSGAATSPSTLTAVGFASNTLDGTVDVDGNASGASATLELQNGITGIAANSTLFLLNSNSLVNLSGGASGNSALTGLTDVAGTFQMEGGSPLTTTGDVNIASTGTVGVDDVASTTGGSNLTVGGALNNGGTFDLGTGTSSSSKSSTARASSFDNSGTTDVGGSSTAGSATFTVDGSAVNSGTVDILGRGSIDVTGGNSYTQNGATSATTISTGASLSAGSYTQNGGTTTVGIGLLGGTLVAPSGVTLNGGTLQGNGAINADVYNIGGTVQGGYSAVNPATLTINGNFIQSAGGTISEFIAGTTNFSVLNVQGGSLTLGGTLDISTLTGFTLATGQTYNIIEDSTGTLSGTFATLEYECPGPNCETTASGGSLVIDGVEVVANYEDSQGLVQLDVETPPATAVTWLGGTGNWSSTTEWSDDALPLSFQDITIGSGTGGTVTYDQASAAINSLTVEAGTVSNYTLSFNPSTALSVATTVNINSGGEIDLAASGASLTTGGDVTNAGTLNVSNGGSLTVGALFSPANLTNTGTMEVDAGTATGGSTVIVTGTLENDSILDIGNSGMTSPTSVTAVGGFDNASVLSMAGASPTNTATLSVFGDATSSALVTIGSYANLTVVGAGNSFTQTPTFVSLTTVNGTLTAPTVNITGGVFTGNGTVNGNVVNSGSIQGGTYLPTTTPGVLTINGSFTQTDAGTVLENIANTGGAPGTNFSVINVSGSVSLSGTLSVTALSGFTFAPGETFDVLNFTPGELTGTFSNLDFGSFSGGGTGVIPIGDNLDLTLQYNSAGGDVVLEVGSLDTWNGATANWSSGSDDTNWSTGAEPTADEDVLIGGGPGGTVTYNVNGSTVESLTVQKGMLSGYTLAFAANNTLVVGTTVSINAGGEIDLEKGSDTLETGGALTNAGTLMIAQAGTVEVGTTTYPANLTNTGTITIDPTDAKAKTTGGSFLVIGGELDNTDGTLNIGNTGISSNSTVIAASFDTTIGTGATAKTSTTTLDGTINITGQDPSKGSSAAVLELGTGVTTIAATGSLTLANSNSFITTDTIGPFSNDALSGLAKNEGSLTLDGGSKVAVTGSFTNSGTVNLADGSSMSIGTAAGESLTNTNAINVDAGTSPGGSTLTVNGTLENAKGTISIGNSGITSAATLSATGFALNTLDGDITIDGGAGAAATLVLNAGNGIQTIAGDSSLILDNKNSFVNVTPGETNNSGLSGLANVDGALQLNGGASVTTSGALNIASGGTVIVDYEGAGGSNLAIGGALNNSGSFFLGALPETSSQSTASSVGFDNSGTVYIGGSAGGAIFTETLGATNSGAVTVGSGGQFNVTGGNPYTQSGSSSSTTVDAGGKFSASTYTLSAGTTTVNGTLTSSGNGVAINGGVMQGNGGTIVGNVSNNSGGTLQASPDGTNPGTLTINGNYTQSAGATLGELISGTSSGQFSVLNITGGSLTLVAGTGGSVLEVSTTPSFSFAAGQTFDILNYTGTLTGTFGTLAYNGFTASGTGPLDISSTLSLALNYTNPGEVELVVASISNTDIWNNNPDPCLTSGATCSWTDGNKDTTNWSLGYAPRTTTNPQTGKVTGEDDVIIGGGPGGTVTLNTNAEVKSLTVEASDNTDTGTNYTLIMNGQYTLTDDGKLVIDQGGTISVTAKGAVLTSGGAATNAGTLTLENGGSVTIGMSGGSSPTNFTNYITPNQNEGNVGPTVAGTINVDVSGTGGSTLTINGTLNNILSSDGTNYTGTLNIGNSDIKSNSVVSIQDFATSGTLDGTVAISGPTGSGTVYAALSDGVAITTIAKTGSLTLTGDNAFIETPGGLDSNSALANLASNAGTLEIDNITAATNTSKDTGGVTTNGNSSGLFANTGTLTLKNTITDPTFNSAAYNLSVIGSAGMTTSGTISIGTDSALQVTKGTFTQTAGTTTVSGDGARLQADAASSSSDTGMDIQKGSTLDVEDGGSVCVGAKACQATGVNRDLTNEGTITMDTTSTSSHSSINVSGNLDNSGKFTIGTTGSLTVGGDVNNSGTFTVNGSGVNGGNFMNVSQVTINGSWDPINFTQTAGSTVVDGSLVAGTINLDGGTLSGTGTITGTLNLDGGTYSGTVAIIGGVTNSSSLTPMSAPQTPGTQSITGSYTQTASGVLDELIAGTGASGSYGQLMVTGTSGTATLGGTLDVLDGTFTNGFTLGSDDTYDDLVLASGGISGEFSTLEYDCPGPYCVTGSGLELGDSDTSAALSIEGGEATMDLIYGADGVDLQVTATPVVSTPEPSTLPMLVVGLLGLAYAMRRKHRIKADG